MYFKTREEEVAFLKQLWQNRPTVCPRCGKGTLTHLHKKAKKSNTECGEVYRTIRMLKELPDQ